KLSRPQLLLRQLLTLPPHVPTFPHQLTTFHSDAIPLFLVPRLPSLQNLFDSAEQAIGIVEHQAVELPALRLTHIAAFQGLQVKANGSNWRFQLVRDRIDKTIVLLVAADFAHQEAGVDD